MRPLAFAIALAALALLTSLHGQTPRPNVLLVTLDTVRADHLGAYGDAAARTPALDGLARQGVRFDAAFTHAPLTGPAHAGILTGQYPARFGIRDNASTPLPAAVPTLASVLGKAGYRTGAFIAAFILDRAYGFDHGFEEFDSRFDRFETGDKLKAERTAGQVVEPALAWLSKQSADRPFFAWVHFYDAHAPYSPPEPYKTAFRARPYDGEIAYVDGAVGRLLALLERKGVLDNTVVVAIGDHGESLGEHGEQEHGLFLYDAVLHVPLIMRLPGRTHAGRAVADQVRAIDVMPTVLDALHVAVPGRLDGRSLMPLVAGRAGGEPPAAYAETYYPQLHFGWSALAAIRVPEWKYVRAPRPELYDLRTDAPERANVIDRQQNVAGRLNADLQGIASAFEGARENAAPMPDAETMARLRSLGYVGFTPSSARTGGADPKDMIGALESFRRLLTDATDALRRRQPAAAVAKLKQALLINERAYDVHLSLGDAYAQMRDYERAVGEYEAAALLNPSSADPVLAAANALGAAGRIAQASAKIDQAAKTAEPRSSEIANARGVLAERQGLFAEALAYFRDAIARNPSDPRPRAHAATVAIELRQFDAAQEQLSVLLKAGFDPARTHYRLGLVAEGRGDRVTATREYRQALAVDPALADARVALARLKRP